MNELPSIALEALRTNDAAAWNEAQPVLWERAWRAVRRKMPGATVEEVNDLAAEILAEEVVPGVFGLREGGSFAELETFADLVNLTGHIAGLRAIDHIRRGVRQGERVGLESIPEGDLATASGVDGELDGEALHYALSRIEERQREVLLDYYFQGLSTEEIARKRTMKKNTVCSDLSRGREAMRRVLEAEGLAPKGWAGPKGGGR